MHNVQWTFKTAVEVITIFYKEMMTNVTKSMLYAK